MRTATCHHVGHVVGEATAELGKLPGNLAIADQKITDLLVVRHLKIEALTDLLERMTKWAVSEIM